MSNYESFSSICKSLYDMPDIRAREVVRLYHEQIVEDVEFFDFEESGACKFATYVARKAMEALERLENSNVDGTFSLTLTQLMCFMFIYTDKYNLLFNKEVLLSGHLETSESTDTPGLLYVGLESFPLTRGFYCSYWDWDNEVKPFIDKVGFITLLSSVTSLPFDSSCDLMSAGKPYEDGIDKYASYSRSVLKSIAVVSLTFSEHRIYRNKKSLLDLMIDIDKVKLYC